MFPSKISYVKRFAVTSVVKDREYDITSGDKNNKLLYFTANRALFDYVLSKDISALSIVV